MKHDTLRYHQAQAFGSNRSVAQHINLLPFLKNLQAIDEACLWAGGQPQPLYIPPHQQALTEKHLYNLQMDVVTRMIDRSMDRFFIGMHRQYNPVTQEIYKRMRDFAVDRKIVFATTPYPAEPTILDSPFGVDIPVYSVEHIHSDKWLTVQRGKHRRNQVQTYQDLQIDIRPFKDIADELIDPNRAGMIFDSGSTIKEMSIERLWRDYYNDPNTIDQPTSEVKELPPPDEPK